MRYILLAMILAAMVTPANADETLLISETKEPRMCEIEVEPDVIKAVPCAFLFALIQRARARCDFGKVCVERKRCAFGGQ